MHKEFNVSKSEAIKQYYSNIESILYMVFGEGEKRCKLFTCKAEIWEYKGILALVSYGTPIAVYSPSDGELDDCLRVVYGYTSTSAQHISKFSKWLVENNYPINSFVRFRE